MSCVHLVVLLVVLSNAVVTETVNKDNLDIQIKELKKQIIVLEEEERQLLNTLEEKVKEHRKLNVVEPEKEKIINRLKNVISMNHEEKKKILNSMRNIIAGLPEVEQSQIIRRNHLEVYTKIYPFLVPHLKKDIPLITRPSTFNLTLRKTLHSGDAHLPDIKKSKQLLLRAKWEVEFDSTTIKDFFISWNNEITTYLNTLTCPFNMQKYKERKQKRIQQLLSAQLKNVNQLLQIRKTLKTHMLKRYNKIALKLTKMIPVKLFEVEEIDLVKHLLNETKTTIETINKEINDVTPLTEVKQLQVEYKNDLSKALAASDKLEKSDSCLEYLKINNIDVMQLETTFKRLAYLEKLNSGNVTNSNVTQSSNATNSNATQSNTTK
ncbi:Uncharacterized protein QTN25_004715 [Entamoeba marina]